jgi:tRNA modification GTPase
MLPPWPADEVRTLLMLTKCDIAQNAPPGPDWLATSAHRGTGMLELRQAIAARLQAVHQGDVVPETAARCRSAIVNARSALTQAQEVLRIGGGEELIAAELRLAIDELGQVLGAVYTDDILDRIFSRFCIGK